MPIQALLPMRRGEKSSGVFLQQQPQRVILNCSVTFDMGRSLCKRVIVCVRVWETAMFGVFFCGYLLNDPSGDDGETHRKLGHNYILVCCFDIDLIWLKNVNSDAN